MQSGKTRRQTGDQGKQGQSLGCALQVEPLLADQPPNALEWLPIGCILCDREFRVSYWNRASASLFGFSRDEMLGRSPYETFVPDAAKAQLEADVAALRQAAAPIRSFSRNLTKDGRLIDCEWHMSAIPDSLGEVAHFICMALDITESIKSQEALKRSKLLQQQLNSHLARTRQAMEEALQARIESEAALLRNKLELKSVNSELKGILDAVEEGLILYSPELEVVWSNRGAVKYFPASGDDPARPLLPPKTEAAPGYVADCFRSASQLSEQITKGNGQVLDILVSPIFGEKGEVLSVLEVVRDVTRETNRQAEALRCAHLASLGELAAGVAHEINNPTHGIISYAELLIREFPGEGRVCDVSKRIVKESERIAHIVRALLDFSRKRDGGKQRLRVEEAVQEAFTLCQSQLKKDNIAVSLERHNVQLLEILADPQQIIQVLLNLISNARYSLNEKYPALDPDKRLNCSLSRVTMDGGSWAKVVLMDQGGGIPEQLLAKVLNPFFTTKAHGRGTGLGLSICNTIVADHGGLLEIASREGTSTTVTLLLPVWRADAA